MSPKRDTGQWSFSTDVVIVGSGGCGLTAAMAVVEGGLEALVLEKQERPLSNTERSGGMIPAAATRFQRAAGIDETHDQFAADIFHKNLNTSDPATTMHLVSVATEMVEWLVDDVGVDLVFIDDFKYPGHTQFRMHAPPNRTGAALVADLRRAVMAHSRAELITDADVTALIADENGAVTGVVVQYGQHEERVQAGKVVLACNGFAGNSDMVATYCPAMENALYFGGEGNTGDGILWGIELGADVAFMDAYQSHASVAVPHAILITYAVIMEGGIQVNLEGKRFGNETSGYSEHSLAVLAQSESVAWNIYDERLHQLGLLFDDYRQAVDVGAIKRASTLHELALMVNLPPTTVITTVDDYHSFADGAADDPFGRSDCRRLEGPFYGVRVTGSLFHTQGGLVVDDNARVLKPDGTHVANLYAGGGAAAGISGHGPGGYLSGNGLLTALAYGMLAGRHAAASMRNA